jgi:hypothetical protein
MLVDARSTDVRSSLHRRGNNLSQRDNLLLLVGNALNIH